ncbi:MAG: sialidase family protein [Kiritimatiellia bacterium]|jgi:hypothetical protein
MQVSKRVYLEPLHKGATILQCVTAYAEPDGLALFQQFSDLIASDTFGRFYSRRSHDNGKTWTEPVTVYDPQPTADGIWRRGESALFLDPGARRLLHFFNYSLYSGDYHDGNVRKRHLIFYEISMDGGQTFSDARQIIQTGYDAKHWMKDVRYGENSAAISFCMPLALPDGKIGLPCQMTPPGEFTNLLIPYRAGMLIGTWAGSDTLNWTFGEFVGVDPALSSRGLCEPAIARLRDGRLMMILRGSNASMPDVPGRKWMALSSDGGMAWSEPAPLAYDNGELFFSPASGSALIRHSRNGKLYWIANVTPENPKGNGPRYPLVIAEVDEARAAICKTSLATIDTKGENDSPLLQLSNFRVHEDRATGEFVVALARWFAAGKDYHCPSTELRIRI